MLVKLFGRNIKFSNISNSLAAISLDILLNVADFYH